MTTTADLTARGFRRTGFAGPLGRSGMPLVEVWQNIDDGQTVRLYRGPDASSASRGHWKFNALAAWCRWHFGKRGKP